MWILYLVLFLIAIFLLWGVVMFVVENWLIILGLVLAVIILLIWLGNKWAKEDKQKQEERRQALLLEREQIERKIAVTENNIKTCIKKKEELTKQFRSATRYLDERENSMQSSLESDKKECGNIRIFIEEEREQGASLLDELTNLFNY